MDTTFVMQIQQILTEEATRELRPLTNNEPLHQDAVLGQVFTASTYLKGQLQHLRTIMSHFLGRVNNHMPLNKS